MGATEKVPRTVDDYIASYPPRVRSVLEDIRRTVRRSAPDAQERISYRMPAFFQDGVLLYFGAFKEHVGVYPPVRGDEGLARALAPYAGEKGNLRFHLDEPIPHDLIERIVRLRLAQNAVRGTRSSRRA